MKPLVPTADSTPSKAWWTAREIVDCHGNSVRSVYDAIVASGLLAHLFGQGRGGIRISETDRLAWGAACRKHRTQRSAGGFTAIGTVTTSRPVT